MPIVRANLPVLRARYDAAQTTDENRRHWANADALSASAANSLDVRRTVRNRARYEVANNCYLSGMVQTLANDWIGTGPRLQLLTQGSALNNRIETLFGDWAREVHLASKLHTMRHAKAVDGELKHGELSEQTFTQQADTHGIMFALTRQMIINDDMGALADIPRQIGMGAAEAIADAVWTLLLSNPTQSDGNAFFSAAHKNYAEGADTALSIDGVTAAEVLFGDQVKPNGPEGGGRAADDRRPGERTDHG